MNTWNGYFYVSIFLFYSLSIVVFLLHYMPGGNLNKITLKNSSPYVNFALNYQRGLDVLWTKLKTNSAQICNVILPGKLNCYCRLQHKYSTSTGLNLILSIINGNIFCV